VRRAGITVDGAEFARQQLVTSSGLVQLRFEWPAATFGVHVKAGGVSFVPPATPYDGWIKLIGYDESGRVVDVATATYPATAPRDSHDVDFALRERFLIVGGCEDAAIVRAELRLSEMNMIISELAFER
jgi:hypothetical protein